MEPLRTSDPARLAGYRLLGRLGAGGMGVVYLARSAGGTLVALKVIQAEYAEDADFRERFRREADTARRMTSPWVASLVDADPEAAQPWLATTFVPGPSLGEALAAHGPLPVPSLRVLGARLAEALGELHAAGLVHRDVKPGNVLLALDGPRLIDFGVARNPEDPALTSTGVVVGTPGFLPLDAMAAAITARTRLVFVCNPNNPTSTAVGARALTEFADRVPRDVLIVVDEAYREYADPAVVPDGLALLGDRPNVVVLRTFSKAYGLAGLRVGYCVAPPGIAAHMRRTQVPFSVSALAQRAAVVALGEGAEVARRAALTVTERDRVAKGLRALGHEVPDSQSNFVWLPLGADTGDFALHCADGKVMVRPFPGEGVRVTIGLPEENDALLALAASRRG